MNTKNNNPLVSIVIANLNGEKWISNLIKSIRQQTYKNIELIFVDGGSTDRSIDILYKSLGNFLKYKVIIENRKGWSRANNSGAKKSSGEIIFFISNDMVINKICIEEIIVYYQSHQNTAVVQCHSISIKNKNLDSGMNYIDRFGLLYGFKPTQKSALTFFAEGMAFACRKKIFCKIWFDNKFIMEYDDVDLCWRIRLQGYDVVFLPTAKVYHGRGATVGETYFIRNSKNIFQYNRNHLVSLTRNLEFKNAIISIPCVLIMRTLLILFFLIRGNTRLGIANFKGLTWYFIELPKTLKQRSVIQSKRKLDDKDLEKLWVPFRPLFLYRWICAQYYGKRIVLSNSLLPKSIYEYDF